MVDLSEGINVNWYNLSLGLFVLASSVATTHYLNKKPNPEVVLEGLVVQKSLTDDRNLQVLLQSGINRPHIINNIIFETYYSKPSLLEYCCQSYIKNRPFMGRFFELDNAVQQGMFITILGKKGKTGSYIATSLEEIIPTRFSIGY